MKKLKVFLGDIVHSWEKVSVWTIPINIGFVGGFLQQELGADVDLRLFKQPEELIAEIRAEKPDVLGLSYYVWNLNLNKLISRIAREANPGVLIVGGGPHFTDLNYKNGFAGTFFATHQNVDAYTLNQGERPTVELVSRFLDCNRDVSKLRSQSVDGCLINDLAGSGKVNVSDPIPGFDDLDTIPSPYLTGLMDDFFEGPYLPIMETNRSCPYRCAYCAWGIGSTRLSKFSLDRVFAEIEYIASHMTKAGTMMVCDANFGILERDVEIARKIHSAHEAEGFPSFVSVQWNKSNPDRIFKVADAFGGIASVGSSRQSLHEPTLEAIGRSNLPIEEVTSRLQDLRVPLFTELILGLPYETKKSHLDANRKLMDWGYEINNYNLHMLPGTRMDSDDYRTRFVRKTGWRLHDNAWGIYDNEVVMEGQEVVLETSTMTMEELRSFRFMHFLFQFMWGKEWYRLYLLLMKNLGMHPVDFMEAVGEYSLKDKGEVGELRKRFAADHDLENFASFDELDAYWTQDTNFDRLRSGDYGKLNMQYTYEVLLDSHDAFNALLFSITEDFLAKTIADPTEKARTLAVCRDVLAYQAGLRFELTDEITLVESKIMTMRHNVLGWAESGCKGLPSLLPGENTIVYEFYLDDEQRDILQNRLDQFSTNNLKMALRKLSEYLAAKYLLFNVRNISSGE